jgi:hypothetical protein
MQAPDRTSAGTAHRIRLGPDMLRRRSVRELFEPCRAFSIPRRSRPVSPRDAINTLRTCASNPMSVSDRLIPRRAFTRQPGRRRRGDSESDRLIPQIEAGIIVACQRPANPVTGLLAFRLANRRRKTVRGEKRPVSSSPRGRTFESRPRYHAVVSQVPENQRASSDFSTFSSDRRRRRGMNSSGNSTNIAGSTWRIDTSA